MTKEIVTAFANLEEELRILEVLVDDSIDAGPDEAILRRQLGRTQEASQAMRELIYALT